MKGNTISDIVMLPEPLYNYFSRIRYNLTANKIVFDLGKTVYYR